MQENIIFEYLKDLYFKQYKKQNYKFFDDDIYIFIPTKLFKDMFNLSNFKQREILNRLEEIGLIRCRLGQSKARYFKIISLELQNKREQIMNRLKELNKNELDKILKSLRIEEVNE